MNITKRTKSEGTTVYQFRVFLSQSADGKQRTRSKTWQPPAGMTAKAAEKEAKRQAVIFENEVKQGRAALDARTKLSDVAREYIRNTEMEYKTKEWYEYMLRVVEDDIGNMPISALKAYQIERIYADMREPDAKRTYCVTATELDKIRKEKGMTYKVLAEKAGLCIRTHADPKTVQTILRHANVSTTLNIYAKVFDSTQMEAIGRVQASLENMLKESCSSSAQV